MTEETLLTIIKIIAGILVGGTLGSFFGVVLYRMPRKMSIVSPGSHCAACKTPLSPRDLIPVVSYFLNGGKCRFCKAAIGFENVFIELVFIVAAVIFFIHI